MIENLFTHDADEICQQNKNTKWKKEARSNRPIRAKVVWNRFDLNILLLFLCCCFVSFCLLVCFARSTPKSVYVEFCSRGDLMMFTWTPAWEFKGLFIFVFTHRFVSLRLRVFWEGCVSVLVTISWKRVNTSKLFCFLVLYCTAPTFTVQRSCTAWNDSRNRWD